MPATTRSRAASLATATTAAATTTTEPVESVLYNSALLLEVLAHVAPPALAAVAAVCRPLHDIVSSRLHWESRLRCDFPASAPLMGLILARCGSARAFYRLRTEEASFQRSWRPSKAKEEARLRRELADTFIELHVTDKETGKVLGARLISVVEEEAALMSLFADEWVPLTYKTDIRSYLRDDQLRLSATLLRLTPAPETVLLGESEDMVGDESLRDGGLYSTPVTLRLPEAAVFDMWYETYLRIRQRTTRVTGKRKLSVCFSMLCYQSEMDTDIELSFKTVVELWGFLEFLLAAKPLWEMQ